MSEMTYQEALAEHMETAPEELKQYVCEMLTDDNSWADDDNPIDYCGFSWDESVEGDEFWTAISRKKWQNAIATEFWQSYKENQFKVSTQSNLTQAYLLIVDYKEHSVYINPQSAFDKASEIMKNTVPPPTYIEVRGIDVIGID